MSTDCIDTIISEFEKIRKKHDKDIYLEGGRARLYEKISKNLASGQPLIWMLPSFPFKSQNPEHTFGKLPDGGEEIALKVLHGFCEKISGYYEHGAKIILASDGRLYADLVGIADEDVFNYRSKLLELYKNIVESDRKIPYLSWYSLDDAFPSVNSAKDKRRALVEAYPQEIETIMERVHSDVHYNRLYVGFKNLMIGELSIEKNRSKKSIEKEASEIAKKMLIRNFANACLLKDRFPKAIRLSVKHHDTSSGIYGVNLLPNHHDIGTPWLNVLVKSGEEEFTYMKRKDAEDRRYIIQENNGVAWFYTKL
ncbi:MAG: L-tyrosine/L-tryptophan isonitrile synthase family protein [archaeon]